MPQAPVLDWELPDPKGRPLAEVRATRDNIKRRVQSLLEGLDAGQDGPLRAAVESGRSSGRR